MKTLAPMMNRAFALNFQIKAIYETCIDELRDVLEEMISKFDSAKAKTALPTVTL